MTGPDPTKLTPAPLHLAHDHEHGAPFVANRAGNPVLLSETDNEDDLEFIALARNAFAGDAESLKWWEANRVKPVKLADPA